jgi:hypothetical protein
MTVEISEGRLARIEEKLDQMSDAIVMLARIDERMLAHVEQQKRLASRQESVESRVTKLELSRAKLLGAVAVLSALGSVVGSVVPIIFGG